MKLYAYFNYSHTNCFAKTTFAWKRQNNEMQKLGKEQDNLCSSQFTSWVNPCEFYICIFGIYLNIASESLSKTPSRYPHQPKSHHRILLSYTFNLNTACTDYPIYLWKNLIPLNLLSVRPSARPSIRSFVRSSSKMTFGPEGP